MQDILIIPTFDRPEFLWLCLDHIVACPEAGELDIRVYVDNHTFHPPPLVAIRSVLENFPQLHIALVVQNPHDYAGNSFNLLTAYKEAFESDANLVFMVEDDVMVRPNFFEWHRQVQEYYGPACS